MCENMFNLHEIKITGVNFQSKKVKKYSLTYVRCMDFFIDKKVKFQIPSPSSTKVRIWNWSDFFKMISKCSSKNITKKNLLDFLVWHTRCFTEQMHREEESISSYRSDKNIADFLAYTLQCRQFGHLLHVNATQIQ